MDPEVVFPFRVLDIPCWKSTIGVSFGRPPFEGTIVWVSASQNPCTDLCFPCVESSTQASAWFLSGRMHTQSRLRALAGIDGIGVPEHKKLVPFGSCSKDTV